MPGDGYFSFRVLLVISALIICGLILLGVAYLPEEAMKVLGPFLDEVPLVGVIFSSLAGIERQLLAGRTVSLSANFDILILCVANNGLDAIFMGIIYSFFTRRSGRGFRAFLRDLPCLLVCTVLSVFVLWLFRQIPNAQVEIIFRGVVSIGLLLIGVGIMLGRGRGRKDLAVRYALNVLLNALKAIAGTDLMCLLFFIGSSLKRLSFGVLQWWAGAVAVSLALFAVATALGVVVYGVGFSEGYLD